LGRESRNAVVVEPTARGVAASVLAVVEREVVNPGQL
jgi:hypothetical protein